MKITKGKFSIGFKDGSTPKDSIVYSVTKSTEIAKLKERGRYNTSLKGIDIVLKYKTFEKGKNPVFNVVKLSQGKLEARTKSPQNYTLHYATDSKELSFYDFKNKEWVDSIILTSYAADNKYYFNVDIEKTKEANK